METYINFKNLSSYYFTRVYIYKFSEFRSKNQQNNIFFFLIKFRKKTMKKINFKLHFFFSLS